MKTARRHELQTNALADWIGKSYAAIKPYTRHILFAVLGLLVVVVAWRWISSNSRSSERQAWDDLLNFSSSPILNETIRKVTEDAELQEKLDRAKTARDRAQAAIKGSPTPEQRENLHKAKSEVVNVQREIKEHERVQIEFQLNELRELAEDHRDEPLGWTAALYLADAGLREGAHLLFEKKPKDTDEAGLVEKGLEKGDKLSERAKLRLDEAVRYYSQVIKDTEGERLIQDRARFGLARTYETLQSAVESDADAKDYLAKAKTEYTKLADKEGGASAYAKKAEEHLAFINQNQFYQWFRTARKTLE